MKRATNTITVPPPNRDGIKKDLRSELAEALEITREEAERIMSSGLIAITEITGESLKEAAYDLVHTFAEEKGISPLMSAVQNGWVSVIRRLLIENTDRAQLRGLLHIAILHGHLKVVELLLDHNVDVDDKDEVGCTPLMQAVLGKEKAIIRFLLDRGANVNKTDREGKSPLMIACVGSIRALRDEYVQSGRQPPSPLFLMSQLFRKGLTIAFGGEDNDDMTIIEWLIDAGAEVNHSDRMGMTPLSVAAGLGRERIVQKLIEAAAENIDRAQLKGLLHISVMTCHLKVVELLLKHGADVDDEDELGMTPLMRAVLVKEMAIIRLLLDRGANVNKTNREGKSPLIMACIGCNKRALQDEYIKSGMQLIPFITSRFSKFSDEDNDDMTIIEWLVNAGAEVNHSGCDGLTPISLASELGRKKTVQKLMGEAAAQIMRAQKIDPMDVLISTVEEFDANMTRANKIKLMMQSVAVASVKYPTLFPNGLKRDCFLTHYIEDGSFVYGERCLDYMINNRVCIVRDGKIVARDDIDRATAESGHVTSNPCPSVVVSEASCRQRSTSAQVPSLSSNPNRFHADHSQDQRHHHQHSRREVPRRESRRKNKGCTIS